jgi:hypothetical protein
MRPWAMFQGYGARSFLKAEIRQMLQGRRSVVQSNEADGVSWKEVEQ